MALYFCLLSKTHFKNHLNHLIMSVETAMEGGITGATTLTILHEIVRKLDRNAPRMDEIGKEVLSNLFKKTKA
jgi:hypothetical protein